VFAMDSMDSRIWGIQLDGGLLQGVSICKIKFFSQQNLSTHPLDFVDLEALVLITSKKA
jgi:hypothetical protein